MKRAWIGAAIAVFGSVATVPPAAAVDPAATSGSVARSPLVFVLDRPLHEGGKTRVRLRNRSDKAFVYNPYYEACQMVFRDGTGRKFLVPEGTHCDLVAREKVEPGETVTLFRWDLDECVKDEWGCAKARDLPLGKYSMRGWFKPAGGGDRVRVTEVFRIRRT